ncbi:MAG: hypothetical protein ACTTIS_04205 [Streptobacillus sp.]
MNFLEKNKYVTSTSIILIIVLLFLLISQIITKNTVIPCVMINFVVLIYVYSIDDKKKKYKVLKIEDNYKSFIYMYSVSLFIIFLAFISYIRGVSDFLIESYMIYFLVVTILINNEDLSYNQDEILYKTTIYSIKDVKELKITKFFFTKRLIIEYIDGNKKYIYNNNFKVLNYIKEFIENGVENDGSSGKI